MTHVLEVISIWAIPLVVAAVALYAILYFDTDSIF